MTKLTDADNLRSTAELQLAERLEIGPATTDDTTLPRLVHELEVHQIELEMQNEELHQARLALEESRDQYVDLYDFAPVGYVTLTAAGRIAKINLTGAKLLGVDRALLLQKSFAKFVVRADQDLWHQKLMRGIENDGKSTVELELRRGDGTVFFVQLDGVRENTSTADPALRSGPSNPCLRIALSDISPRKALERELLRRKEDLQSQEAERTAALRAGEEKFRGAFANTTIGLAMVALDGNFVEMNPAFCRLTGYSNEELRSMAFPQLIHPDDLEANLSQFNSMVSGRIRDYVVENRSRHKDGHTLWVRKSVSLMHDPSARPQMVVALVEDITDRKQAEDDLRNALADTERANNAKSRFLAAASHDLRQPLSALSVYAGLLNKTQSPSDQKIVTNMQDCIRGLSELLNNLLDLSKLQAGVVSPRIGDFSIAEMLADLESVHGPEAEAKGLRLRAVPTKLAGRTDWVLFRRSVVNLIDNALRYTDRGGVLIACRRRLGKTWIEVWDTGIGIPADKTEAIFEEFYQLGDGARNNGSGLGLAIVAKTSALLGLEIRVRSRPGFGSMFAIELPLGQSVLPVHVPVPSTSAFRSMRIALVEDNPMVSGALLIGLERLGHQVLAAATKAALLTKLDQFPLDIVVSDYRLPEGKTGIDVITEVRARIDAKLPAILITGDTDPTLLRDITESGIVVLHKPVDLDTLQAYIEDLTYQATQDQ